jgi:hypothetical protein
MSWVVPSGQTPAMNAVPAVRQVRSLSTSDGPALGVTVTPMTAPGWYSDENNPTVERYYNGGSWQGESRPRRDGTPLVRSHGAFDADLDVDVDVEDRPFEELMLEIAGAQLAEQRRAANYLAILTYITVLLLVLSIVVPLAAYVISRN